MVMGGSDVEMPKEGSPGTHISQKPLCRTAIFGGSKTLTSDAVM